MFSCTGQGNGMDNMSVVIQIKIIKHFIIQISQTELDYSNTKVHRSCLQALTSLYTSILLYRYLHLTLINETTSSIQIKWNNALLCFKKKRWTHINNLYINTLILILIPNTCCIHNLLTIKTKFTSYNLTNEN